MPDPVLSYSFDEGMGGVFHPTHGSASGWSNNAQWTAGPTGHGAAAGRAIQDTWTQTWVVDGTPVPGVDSWTALSAMCWYRPLASAGSLDRIPFIFYDMNELDWLGIAQHVDGRFEAWIGSDNTNLTATTVADDTWAHLAVVWSGTALYCYIDGVLAESRSTTAVTSILDKITLSGASWAQSGGTIDDFRLYDIALTPEQINEIKDIPL